MVSFKQTYSWKAFFFFFLTFPALRSCSSSSSPVLCPHLPLPSGTLPPLRVAGSHLVHLLDPPPPPTPDWVRWPLGIWTRLLPSKIKASSAPRCCSPRNHSGVAVFPCWEMLLRKTRSFLTLPCLDPLPQPHSPNTHTHARCSQLMQVRAAWML